MLCPGADQTGHERTTPPLTRIFDHYHLRPGFRNHTDPCRSLAVVGARDRERVRHRTAEQSDEFAPSHVHACPYGLAANGRCWRAPTLPPRTIGHHCGAALRDFNPADVFSGSNRRSATPSVPALNRIPCHDLNVLEYSSGKCMSLGVFCVCTLVEVGASQL